MDDVELNLVQDVWNVLNSVMDPEVPVLSVVDLGIIRSVTSEKGAIRIKITPTYSGCPAMDVIEENVSHAMNLAGYQDVIIETILYPAWTSDWMSEEGKQKLKEYGIAPPGKVDSSIVQIGSTQKKIACPFCDSKKTSLKSEFGSTACKALYVCDDCKQPFEYFKAF